MDALAIDSTGQSGLKRTEEENFLSEIMVEAVTRAGVTAEQMKILKEKRRDLLGQTVITIRELVKKNSQEKIISSYRYPQFEFRSIEKQIKNLCQLFPFLNPKTCPPPQMQLDGIFAVPNPLAIADSYIEAVRVMFKVLRESRRGHPDSPKYDQIDERHLRLRPKTKQAFDKLREQQENRDILLICCQLGSKYAGQSQIHSLESMDEKEFPIDSLGVFTILYTHASRLRHDTDLGIDIVGNEFLGKDGQFSEMPTFFCDENGFLVFSSRKNGACERFGTISGFIPKT